MLNKSLIHSILPIAKTKNGSLGKWEFMYFPLYKAYSSRGREINPVIFCISRFLFIFLQVET